MKNVNVNITVTPSFPKKMIHNSVLFLKNELNLKFKMLVVNFISSEEMIKINSHYLNHNYSTDIITFGYSETNFDIDGEIYICVDDAMSNALKYKNSFREEIIRLVTHGILHMSGYDDRDPVNQNKMKIKENELVKKQNHIWNE